MYIYIYIYIYNAIKKIMSAQYWRQTIFRLMDTMKTESMALGDYQFFYRCDYPLHDRNLEFFFCEYIYIYIYICVYVCVCVCVYVCVCVCVHICMPKYIYICIYIYTYIHIYERERETDLLIDWYFVSPTIASTKKITKHRWQRFDI